MHSGVADLRETAQICLGVEGVMGAEVFENDARAGGPAIEMLVGPGYERVPPRVHRTLAECDAGVWSTTPRQSADGRVFVVVVV